jgi:hypothetical protein
MFITEAMLAAASCLFPLVLVGDRMLTPLATENTNVPVSASQIKERDSKVPEGWKQNFSCAMSVICFLRLLDEVMPPFLHPILSEGWLLLRIGFTLWLLHPGTNGGSVVHSFAFEPLQAKLGKVPVRPKVKKA